MFFFKKQSPKPEENVAKKGIKHMDAVVTGVILGSIVGSIYGVKKLHEKHEHTHDEHTETHDEEPKKPSLLKRIFH